VRRYTTRLPTAPFILHVRWSLETSKSGLPLISRRAFEKPTDLEAGRGPPRFEELFGAANQPTYEGMVHPSRRLRTSTEGDRPEEKSRGARARYICRCRLPGGSPRRVPPAGRQAAVVGPGAQEWSTGRRQRERETRRGGGAGGRRPRNAPGPRRPRPPTRVPFARIQAGAGHPPPAPHFRARCGGLRSSCSVTGARAAQAFGYTPSLYELVDVLNWGRLCKIDVVLAMYSTFGRYYPLTRRFVQCACMQLRTHTE
jgi:hypothetical protein